MTNEERMALMPQAMEAIQAAHGEYLAVGVELKAAQAEVNRLYSVQSAKQQVVEKMKKELFDMIVENNNAQPT